jgi:hypothetical protein
MRREKVLDKTRIGVYNPVSQWGKGKEILGLNSTFIRVELPSVSHFFARD